MVGQKIVSILIFYICIFIKYLEKNFVFQSGVIQLIKLFLRKDTYYQKY